MSFLDLLGHRCSVQAVVVGEDAFGHQQEDEWTTVQTGIPCRITRPSGREVTSQAIRDGKEVTHVLYAGTEFTFTEGQRIEQVTDAEGALILRVADIVLVRLMTGLVGKGHHQEIALRALRD